jgi:DNA modification methylase
MSRRGAFELMEIVNIAISDLIHPEYNPRQISEKDFEQLKKSLTGFGAVEPAVINNHPGRENIIVGGNQRIRAALHLGWKEYPCYIVDLPEERERELNIRLNKNTGEWDMDILANEFEIDNLKEWGFSDEDLKLGKFGRENTVEDAGAQIDKAEELREKWKVEAGQLWELGNHRILCGDSTSGGDVLCVMKDDKATCIFTDPPYGVSIGKKNSFLNSFQPSGRNLNDIQSDDLSPEELKKVLLPSFINAKEISASDDCTFFTCAPQGGELGMMMMMMMKEAGLATRHVLIWKKNAPTFSMGRLDYDYQHEPILLTWCKKHKRPMGGTMKTSVWDVDKPRSNKDHPTMKPVELYENAYLNNSDSGDVVYDPYSGSGTAIIAAEKTGRKCRAIEISPAYVAVSIERWAQSTGKHPELINAST